MESNNKSFLPTDGEDQSESDGEEEKGLHGAWSCGVLGWLFEDDGRGPSAYILSQGLANFRNWPMKRGRFPWGALFILQFDWTDRTKEADLKSSTDWLGLV